MRLTTSPDATKNTQKHTNLPSANNQPDKLAIMDKIKAILHGTSPEEEREKKEEKKEEKRLEKEEKKLEKEGHHSGEASHLGSSTHHNTTTTHPPNINPTPKGVAGTAGGLGHNTMKTDYNSTPTDGNLTTHDRHAEREANIGAGGVDVPYRSKDSEHTHASGLSGVGNGSNITGPTTQVHGINSATGTSEAGLASQQARDPLSSHTVGGTDSHHGRDAALGAGAAVGAAEMAHHSHGQHRSPNDNAGLGSGISGTHDTHHGRDAALGSGAAVGAAGLAHHEHGQHHNTHDSHRLGSGVGGPHTTTTANLLDPKVNPNGPTESAHKHHGHSGRVEGGGAEEADGDHGGLGTSAGTLGKREFEAGHTVTTTAGPHSSNLANKADPRVDSDLSKSQGHHYGRDAAVAGGLGAAGAAAYGAGHHDNTTTAGPHSSNLANKADPRVDNDLSRNQDHHYGRDAALAGGAGAAGLGAHQAGHSTHHDPNTLSSGTTGYGNTTAGPHSSNLANKADPRVDSDNSHAQSHHYGRDAAVAGGVGAAGYEANKHLGHNNPNTTHTTHDPTTTTTTTTSGPHSSNLANKADPRVDSDNSHSQSHHLGRDAAVAGGVGAAGYEANKHLGHDNTTHNTHGTHDTHLNKTPLDQKPPGKDLGDHLHGVERNRGVPGETGFPHSEGAGHHHGSTSSAATTGLAHGRDPAVGTGVPGAPRGNVLKGEHEHEHAHGAVGQGVHNGGVNGPEHIFTAPVMNDPKANHDLIGAGGEHGHGAGHNTSGVGNHGVGHTTGHHHEHGAGQTTSTATGGLGSASGHTAESQAYGAGTTGSHVPGTTGTGVAHAHGHGDRVL
ncbi:hypothetical protein ACMFMF_008779 [Clarireedia jacksonii]